MSNEDVADQAAIAATFDAAIAAIEQHLEISSGTLGVGGEPDLSDSDNDAIQQLLSSLEQANAHIANGELALADIGFNAQEEAASA